MQWSIVREITDPEESVNAFSDFFNDVYSNTEKTQNIINKDITAKLTLTIEPELAQIDEANVL